MVIVNEGLSSSAQGMTADDSDRSGPVAKCFRIKSMTTSKEGRERDECREQWWIDMQRKVSRVGRWGLVNITSKRKLSMGTVVDAEDER